MSDTFPLLEVAKHATRDDAWVVIDGRVLDVTQFLDQHPGGEDILLSVAGKCRFRVRTRARTLPQNPSAHRLPRY